MANEKFTRKSQEALSEAIRTAAAAGNPNVDGLHLLAALIAQKNEGTAYPLLQAVGADPEAVLKTVSERLARLPRAAGATLSAPETSRPLLAALNTAEKRASEMGDEYISTEHLLVGLATDGGQAATVLREAGAVDDFVRAETPEQKKKAADAVQVRAMQVVTHVPLGEWFSVWAVRSNIEVPAVPPPVSVFWGMSKK